MVRLTFLMRRRSGLTREQFQRYWSETHGPLVAGVAHTLRMLRYVQVHTMANDMSKELAGARGPMEEPYDGVEETWWNSREDIAGALESSQGKAVYTRILEDEKEFADLPKSPLWLNYEYPQVNASPENIVAKDTSSVVKLYFIFRPPAGLSHEKAQLYWRTSHGPLIRMIAESGHIRRYIQVHRYEDSLEREWRKLRGTVAEPYCGHAELWYNWADLLAPEMPERVRGVQLAVEDERKFIDFARSSMWLAREKVFVDGR